MVNPDSDNDYLDRDFQEKRKRDFPEEKRKREPLDDLVPEKRKRDFDEPEAPVKVIVYKKNRGCSRFVSLGGCIILILAIAACIGLFGAGLYFSLKPASDAASAFMRALRDEDYLAAYNMLSPEAQASYSDSAGLRSALNEFGAKPVSWSTTNWNVSGNSGQVSGTVQLSQGGKQNLVIYLINQNGWKITSFTFGGRSYP